MSVLPTVAKVVGIVALSDGVWWLLKKPVLSIWFGVLSYKEETFVTSENRSDRSSGWFVVQRPKARGNNFEDRSSMVRLNSRDSGNFVD